MRIVVFISVFCFVGLFIVGVVGVMFIVCLLLF